MSTQRWPHGLAEVKAFYGDPSGYLTMDGQGISEDWSRDILKRLSLPQALTLWNGAVTTNIWCHTRVMVDLGTILASIDDAGLWPNLSPYGGCFSWRKQAEGQALSTHAWGIALDFRIDSCRRGTPGDMPLSIVEAFEGAGWTWGGRWHGRRCDPMHVQACSGY